jgi:outer membrane protein assembly factor BamB
MGSLLIINAFALAQDWPQFLGPDRNSTSPQKNLLRSWPETGPEILWSVPVGIGYGGPVVKNGKVYLADRDDKTGDNLRCFDLSTGKELWNYAYGIPGSVMFPGSRSVPAVDGNYVYSCGQYGDLCCIDINTHQPAWKVNIWTDFGGQLPEGETPGYGGPFPTWAISQCPLVYGDLLIVASQAPQAGVVAFNKNTGAVKWKTPSLGNTGYVSPTIVKIDGNDHLVMITASSGGRGGQELVPGNVVGIDPLHGEILWKFTEWQCGIPVPGALDAGNNQLLLTGGYELGALMIKVDKKADGSYGTTELFRTVEFGDQTKTPLFYNGHFYAEYGTNNRRDGMVCMNLKGEIMWKTKRDPDFNKGSIILADGLILATDGAKMLYLIEPDPTAFKLISKAELLAEQKFADERSARHGTQNWAPIALADGKLLIRDQSRMLCLKVVK